MSGQIGIDTGVMSPVAPAPACAYPWDSLMGHVSEQFAEAVSDPKAALFRTAGTKDLYDTFLAHIPESVRQNHSCNCCRDFVNRFGGLVTIDRGGRTKSVFWDSETAPAFYAEAISAVGRQVEAARISTVFVTDQSHLGTPATPPWTHLHAGVPVARISTDRLRTPGQISAKYMEDFKTLSRALADFSLDVITDAVALLRSGELPRAEVVLGPASFFLGVHKDIQGLRGNDRAGVIWRAVAAAPQGWASPRSHMTGNLMEMIKAGKSRPAIVRAFSEAVDPLNHLRPKAAPSLGNIGQAEKIVEALGIAPSLARRHALIGEVPLLWSPSAPEAPRQEGGSVFGHLRGSATRVRGMVEHTAGARTIPISWVKFARDVLPGARAIQARMASVMNFHALTTAVNADAPPIVQWDEPDARNPVAGYCYSDGSAPSMWSLGGKTWVDVVGICLKPWMWSDRDYSHRGKSALLILSGTRDVNSNESALFPGILRSELHEVRATIEAHSKKTPLAPIPLEAQAASGLSVGLGDPVDPRPATIAVATDLGTSYYAIDRWE